MSTTRTHRTAESRLPHKGAFPREEITGIEIVNQPQLGWMNALKCSSFDGMWKPQPLDDDRTNVFSDNTSRLSRFTYAQISHHVVSIEPFDSCDATLQYSRQWALAVLWRWCKRERHSAASAGSQPLK